MGAPAHAFSHFQHQISERPKEGVADWKDTAVCLVAQFCMSYSTCPDGIPPVLFAAGMTAINALYIVPRQKEIQKMFSSLWEPSTHSHRRHREHRALHW
jgi:hypothetical protein